MSPDGATASCSSMPKVPPETVQRADIFEDNTVPPANSSVEYSPERQNGPLPAAIRTSRSQRTLTPSSAAHTEMRRSAFVPDSRYSRSSFSVSISSVPL